MYLNRFFIIAVGLGCCSSVVGNQMVWSDERPWDFEYSAYKDAVEMKTGHGDSIPLKYGQIVCNDTDLFVALQIKSTGKFFVAIFKFENGICWRLEKDNRDTKQAFRNAMKELYPTFQKVEEEYYIGENRVNQIGKAVHSAANVAMPLMAAASSNLFLLNYFVREVVTKVDEYDIPNKLRMVLNAREMYDKYKHMLQSEITPTKIMENWGGVLDVVQNALSTKQNSTEKLPLGNTVVWEQFGKGPLDFIAEDHIDAVKKASKKEKLHPTPEGFGTRGDDEEQFVAYREFKEKPGFVVAIFRRKEGEYVLEAKVEGANKDVFEAEVQRLYETFRSIELAYTIEECYAEFLAEGPIKPEKQVACHPTTMLPFSKVHVIRKCRLVLTAFLKEVTSPTKEDDKTRICTEEEEKKKLVATQSSPMNLITTLQTGMSMLEPANTAQPQPSSTNQTCTQRQQQNRFVWNEVVPEHFQVDDADAQVLEFSELKKGSAQPKLYGRKVFTPNRLVVIYKKASVEKYFAAVFQLEGNKWVMAKDGTMAEDHTFQKGIQRLYESLDVAKTAYSVADSVVHEMAENIPTTIKALSALAKLVENYANPELSLQPYFFVQNVINQGSEVDLHQKYKIFQEITELMKKLSNVVTETLCKQTVVSSPENATNGKKTL